MENVFSQAEQLAEAILGSEVFIKMRLSEEAAMNDEEATQLISNYSERRAMVEGILSASKMDPEALTKANERLKEAEAAVDENVKIKAMRSSSTDFNNMMQQVNRIIKQVVTGEDTQSGGGCSGGSCSSCSGGCCGR